MHGMGWDGVAGGDGHECAVLAKKRVLIWFGF